MRIAVIHGLPMGGALRWAFDTTVRLATTHDVQVFEVTLGDGIGNLWPQNVPVSSWTVDHPGKLPGNLSELVLQGPWWRAQRRLATVLDESCFDVVLAHPCQVTQAPAALALTRHPTAYFMQEVRRRSYETGYRDRPTGNWVRRTTAAMALAAEDAWPRRIDRRAVSASTVVLANSAFTAESSLRTYGREARTCLLGVDTRVFCLPSTTNRRRDHLLLVGGLERNKGALCLIEALGRLSVERPPLVITGQRAYGPYVEELFATARRRGVVLEVKENIDEGTLVALYQAAMATCCVGRLEPFGLTTVESLACGTPVIAFREGGYREVVMDGNNGRLVERSATALADAIADVISRNWNCSALRASVVPQYDITAAVQRLDARLQAVHDRTSKPHRSPIE